MASPLNGFRDPVRRPRYIIAAGLTLILGILLMIVSLGVTSTYWFCANGCHKVQDDTIEAYQRSSHSNVSCMACHGNVDGNPVKFVLHKAEALGELYLAATNTYELPLNARSEVAVEMQSDQCTQCHTTQRRITPTKGILIDHAVHEKNGVSCTSCHNRIAHKEDFELKLKDPKSGEPNRKHADNMTMDACFRCHGLGAEAKAPGRCSACHPKGFELKPPSHSTKGFYRKGGESRGHAKLAVADEKKVADAEARERAEQGEASARAEGVGGLSAHELPSTDSISTCETCHDKEQFCTGCHGVPMPHPKGFNKGHGGLGKKRSGVCANCHAKGEAAKRGTGTEFCNGCHHKAADPSKPWIPQHFVVVREKGAQSCISCHDPTYCAKCHVHGKVD